MDELYEINRKKTFQAFFQLYFMMYFFYGILPVNIDNLLNYLPNTTTFGVGFLQAFTLIVAIISILFFGYFEDKIAMKYSRKKIFIITNLVWIISYGLVSLSVNYYFYLIFYIISAIGVGAFLPIGFSMIGDFFAPIERGKKFGIMNFALILGSGMGIIAGGLLGDYVAGPLGWRISYVVGFVLSVLPLFFYITQGIEPERGRVEPEFKDFKGEINYNYKFTLKSLTGLFRRKSIGAILDRNSAILKRSIVSSIPSTFFESIKILLYPLSLLIFIISVMISLALLRLNVPEVSAKAYLSIKLISYVNFFDISNRISFRSMNWFNLYDMKRVYFMLYCFSKYISISIYILMEFNLGK